MAKKEDGGRTLAFINTPGVGREHHALTTASRALLLPDLLPVALLPAAACPVPLIYASSTKICFIAYSHPCLHRRRCALPPHPAVIACPTRTRRGGGTSEKTNINLCHKCLNMSEFTRELVPGTRRQPPRTRRVRTRAGLLYL